MEKSPIFEKVYKENLFIMKLLVTQPEFLEDVKIIKERLNIPEIGFKNTNEKNKWLGKNLKKLPLGTEGLHNPNSLFHNVEKLIEKFGLKYNFLLHIKKFILFNEVDAPKYNFDVSTGPDSRGIRSNKWVSIKAYASLTKEEIRAVTKRLLKLQKEFLPKRVTLDLRPRKDINKLLEIESEMNKRYKVFKEEPVSQYLAIVKKQCGNKKYNELKKTGNYAIEKFWEKYTSKNIAKKFYKDSNKASLVRKEYARLQEIRLKLFGNSGRK